MENHSSRLALQLCTVSENRDLSAQAHVAHSEVEAHVCNHDVITLPPNWQQTQACGYGNSPVNWLQTGLTEGAGGQEHVEAAGGECALLGLHSALGLESRSSRSGSPIPREVSSRLQTRKLRLREALPCLRPSHESVGQPGCKPRSVLCQNPCFSGPRGHLGLHRGGRAEVRSSPRWDREPGAQTHLPATFERQALEGGGCVN